MTKKTLGQIASETMGAMLAKATAIESADPVERAARWESVANTIASMVIDRCKRECFAQIGEPRPKWVKYEGHIYTVDACIDAISRIKF